MKRALAPLLAAYPKMHIDNEQTSNPNPMNLGRRKERVHPPHASISPATHSTLHPISPHCALSPQRTLKIPRHLPFPLPAPNTPLRRHTPTPPNLRRNPPPTRRHPAPQQHQINTTTPHPTSTISHSQRLPMRMMSLLPPRLILMFPPIPIDLINLLLHNPLRLKFLILPPQLQRRARIFNAVMIPRLDLLSQEEFRQQAEFERPFALFE